ncbi:DUF5677 domain-containing protein [Paenibacillus antarcticus]|uniref:Uncharacterized protein n=1 Tax=Paenibacillus antarcticus TaxID=253703 RepID=A0A168QNS3_9BACL|nr:DUF5677 domain-containing protein [Paenibacillus antarcticus]OAB48004.1 hypothetical protein PBAT_03785 [Paenibacillus antarcticus]
MNEEEKYEKILNPKITDFKFDKKAGKLVNPYNMDNGKRSSMYLYSLVIGHLWIIELISQNGYGEYLNEIISYAENNSTNLVEWMLTETQAEEISDILKSYGLNFEKKIVKGLNVNNYKSEFEGLKTKDHPYNVLSRYFHLIKMGHSKQIKNFFEEELGFEENLSEHCSIINAIYLGLTMTDYEQTLIYSMSDNIIEILTEESLCSVEYQELRYYPKNVGVIPYISAITEHVSKYWENYSDNEQILLSKLIYSLRILSELNISLIGLNGILSSMSTRVLFDNYWQSKYLIENNEVEKYKDYALDRLRLHILKRTGREDIKDIDILRVASENNLIAPIPINGDYFTKSVREICIQLGLKNEYDKFYEYNSEFIHASLTAVLSGLMTECSNPEHNFHLTINPSASRYIDSMPHIVDIINMHIELINGYIGKDVFEKFDLEELYFQNRTDFLQYMKKNNE